MNAVVTVLPLNVFMVYTGMTLPFTIVLEEWVQYLCGSNSAPQKMEAVWSHGTLCHPTVLCCVKTQNFVIWWSALNMEAWKPLCRLVFLLCNAHLLSWSLSFSSALALWPLLFGLMIWQLPHAFPNVSRMWHACTHTGHDIWHLLWWLHVCVFCKRGSTEFSPAL